MANFPQTNIGDARLAAPAAAFASAKPIRLARSLTQALSLGAAVLYCGLLFSIRRSA
jgi:hypothetical protein